MAKAAGLEEGRGWGGGNGEFFSSSRAQPPVSSSHWQKWPECHQAKESGKCSFQAPVPRVQGKV